MQGHGLRLSAIVGLAVSSLHRVIESTELKVLRVIVRIVQASIDDCVKRWN